LELFARSRALVFDAMPTPYPDPVARLLAYGAADIRRHDDAWPNYLELGFANEHVSDLIRMMTDDALNSAAADSLEIWAPLHAWRSLGQLQAIEAAEPLVRLFERFPDDDWLPVEIPRAVSLIGPTAIPVIADFLADAGVEEMSRISAPACLERMAMDHPQHRGECIDVLERQLTCFRTNEEGHLNAFLILSLSNLNATGAIETIRQAFAAGCVDLSVQGDVEDVEIDMGLRLARETPPPDLGLMLDRRTADGHRSWDDGLADMPSETIRNRTRHIGRNDPCPCGSGKKFKKCCLQ
jgi:hypothetical protein